MKFHQLKISNFGSIGEMALPLEGQGLALLLGRNEDAPLADSNGAGKSLPLDAFTWCLWGNTIRGVSSDEVIHNKEKKNCIVDLNFSDGDKEYRVVRYRNNTLDKSHKPNDLLLFVDGEEASGNSMAATQDMLTDILGLDFTTFCAMMPGAGINVASMTDAEVKSLLEKLLRTQVLSKASDEARKRLRVLSDGQLTKNTQLKDLDVSIESAIQRGGDLRARQETFVADRDEKKADIEKLLEEHNSRRATLIQSLQREQQIDENLAKYLQDEGKARDALAKAKELSLQADLQFRKRLEDWNKENTVCETKIESLEEQKNGIMDLEGACPTCTQEVSKDHKESIVKGLLDKLQQLADTKDDLKNKRTQLNQEWEESKANRTAILDQLTEKLNKSGELVSLAKTKKAEMRELSLKLETVESRIEPLEAQLKELEADENPYAELLEYATAELANKEKEREVLKEELEDISEEVGIMKFWVDSFSPQGLRSFMLENVTPILNSYAKTYSDLITDGEMEITFSTKDELKSGKKKEKFNIKVSQKHGGDSYASNSSGERARANLIIALALGELAAMRADKVIPFRFLDEPFESIDETGVEAIVNLLNQMRDKYNTVYVITHQDYLKQLFSNKMTIVKSNGYSTLEK